jgi:hypothetical protein
MNAPFEFDDLPEIPREATCKFTAWLLVFCVLWCSTDVARVSSCLRSVRSSVAAARALDAQINATQLARIETMLVEQAERNRYETEWTGNLPLVK